MFIIWSWMSILKNAQHVYQVSIVIAPRTNRFHGALLHHSIWKVYIINRDPFILSYTPYDGPLLSMKCHSTIIAALSSPVSSTITMVNSQSWIIVTWFLVVSHLTISQENIIYYQASLHIYILSTIMYIYIICSQPELFNQILGATINESYTRIIMWQLLHSHYEFVI